VEQAKRQAQQQAIERKRQEAARKAEQQRVDRAAAEAVSIGSLIPSPMLTIAGPNKTFFTPCRPTCWPFSDQPCAAHESRQAGEETSRGGGWFVTGPKWEIWNRIAPRGREETKD
jgi:hypothetical protein